jgi:AcrR family transcriptional regulator
LDNQELARRKPRQARARYKVELIFEAAMRLIERDGIDGLTTNAVAQTAGVSIGTLYQYFGDKHALLQAMVEREMEELAARIRSRVVGQPAARRGDRVRVLVGTVLETYGGRRRAHSSLMSYAMNHGRPGLLARLFDDVARWLVTRDLDGAGEAAAGMTPVQAYVLASAIFGVLRNLVALPVLPHGREDIEEALVRLVLGFIDTATGAGS